MALYTHADLVWPIPNIYLGVSVEDQATANERISLLLQTPAAVRWISAEPLLAPVDLAQSTGQAIFWRNERDPDRRIDWVVAGGESGPRARPSHPDWFRSLRDQCADAGVPFFFKQHGEWAPVGPIYCDEDTPAHLAALETDDDTDRECHVTPSGYFHRARFDGQPPPGTWAMRRVGKKIAGRLLDGHEHSEYPA